MEIDLDKIRKEKTVEELLEFGILNIDKPSGPTSFDISDLVREKLEKAGLRKTSHFGTLDPKVTGILPISTNRACKLTGFFIGEDKEYVGIMRLSENLPTEKIQKKINEKFIGKILQTPPVKSRVKRVEREREIKRFEVVEKKDKDFLFIAEVQGGTYIRKLIHDLGDELGIGAHMLELRRTRAGIFRENDEKCPFVNLYEMDEALEKFKKGDENSLKKMIIPAEIVSEIYPIVEIQKNNLNSILTGKPIHKDDLVDEKSLDFDSGKKISVFCGERFIGMYKVEKEKSGKGIYAKPEFVMQPVR